MSKLTLKTLDSAVDALWRYCLERAVTLHATRNGGSAPQTFKVEGLAGEAARMRFRHFPSAVEHSVVDRRGNVIINKRRRKRANVFIRSLVCAHLLAGWPVPSSKNLFLFTWLADRYSIALFGREECFYPSIKAACVEMRRLSLLGKGATWKDGFGLIIPRGYQATPTQLYQLSRLSRALPSPTKAVQDKKLDDFLVLATTRDEDPDDIFLTNHASLLFEEFVGLSQRYKNKVAKGRGRAGRDVCGTSACLEFKRREGGRSMDFLSKEGMALAPRFQPVRVGAREYQFGDPEHNELSKQLYSDTASDFECQFPDEKHSFRFAMKSGAPRTRYERAKARYLRRNRIPVAPMMACAVPERGWKVRVVTRSPAVLVAKNHQIRRVLYRELERIPTISASLKGSPPSIRIYPLRGVPPGRRYVISADMSGATDTMRHRWLDIACAFLAISPEELHSSLRVNGQDYTCGCPMGLPNSWCILSLSHEAICRVVDPSGSYAIRGDDLIAYWTKAQFELYKALCFVVGFKLNLQKTFMAPKGGCFCEERYVLRGMSLVRAASVPVRWVSSEDSPDGSNFMLSIAGFANECISFGFARQKIVDVIEFVHGTRLREARALGVIPELPVGFGGLGFPIKDPEAILPRKIHRKVDAIATGSDIHPPQLKVRGGKHLRDVQKMASKIAYRCTDNFPCYHLDLAVHNAQERAAIMDLKEGTLTQRTIGYKRLLRQCAKSYRSIPLARPPEAMEGGRAAYRWKTLTVLHERMAPTAESLIERRHTPSGWCGRCPNLKGSGTYSLELKGNPKQ